MRNDDGLFGHNAAPNTDLREPMARLQRKTPHERREHVVTIASEMFARNGYNGTTMSSISNMLGGSKATLYKYFLSKELLFEAVIQKHCQRILIPLQDLHGGIGYDLEDFLTSFARLFVTGIYHPDALKLHRLIHSEGVRFPQLVSMFFQSGPAVALKELSTALKRFGDAGQIICDDYLLVGAQFLGMLRGERYLHFAANLVGAPSEEEIIRYTDQAVRIFLRGLLAD